MEQMEGTAVFEEPICIHPESSPLDAEPADKLLDRVTRREDYERLAKMYPGR